jgi:glutamine amidotransferase-like uncharacterized protein
MRIQEKLLRTCQFFSLVSLFYFSAVAEAARPIALVYAGDGSCTVAEGDCTAAAETAAQYAGYYTIRIGPNALTSTSTETDYQNIFAQATVWVQPGGHSQLFLQTITPEMKTAIRRFVSEGGGYVGFCAGAFSATALDGSTDTPGLGIFPGATYPYPNETLDSFFDNVVSYFNVDAVDNSILPVTWEGKLRYLYFEEGTSLNLTGVPANTVETIATLPDGQVIAARTHFGLGKVFITGAHPEAPQRWRTFPYLNDPDGMDLDLVQEMLSWSAKTITSENPFSQALAKVKSTSQSLPASPKNNTAKNNVAKNSASYVGQFAKYVTTSHTAGNPTEMLVGTSLIRVIDFNASTQKYDLVITNTPVYGAPNVVNETMTAAELAGQKTGDLFKNCTIKGGVPSLQITIEDMQFASCEFINGNTNLYTGIVPFTVFRSVSTSNRGVIYTTNLTDFQAAP